MVIVTKTECATLAVEKLLSKVEPIRDTEKGKRRTKEEIATEKAVKEQVRDKRNQERDEKRDEKERLQKEKNDKKEKDSVPLEPGTGINAVVMMTILSKLSSDMKKTEHAFRRIITSRMIFPPKKNANKFMVGSCGEMAISELIASVGFVAHNVSNESTIIDLNVELNDHTIGISLKNSGDIKTPPILENYRGNKRDEIRPLPPTLIIYTEMTTRRARIVYLDDEIIRQAYPSFSKEEIDDAVFKNHDSHLTFKSGFLKKFIPRLPAEYILNCPYPEGLSCSEKDIAQIGLAEVDRQLESTNVN